MAVIATDNFTGTTGTAIVAYGAGTWEKVTNTLNDICRIQANQARLTTDGVTESAVRRTETYPDDQYAKATVTSVPSSNWFGVAVRCQAPNSGSYYGYYSDTGGSFFFKVVSNTFTDLVASMPAWSNNDVVEIRAVGSTISAWKNGVQVASVTDTTFSSGKPGLCGYGDSLTALIDDFEAGDIGGSVTLEQEGFRFRNDDGPEATATWAAAQDTDAVIPVSTPIRLRFIINATGDPASGAFKLQFRKVGDTDWRDVN